MCMKGGYAHVAQSAEHILGKDEVTGSIPVMGFLMNGIFDVFILTYEFFSGKGNFQDIKEAL